MSQGKETSLELQNLIVKLKDENKSYSEIAKIVKTRSLCKQSIEITLWGEYAQQISMWSSTQAFVIVTRAIVRKVKKIRKLVLQIADQIQQQVERKYIQKLFLEFFDQAVTIAEFPERNRSSHL
ncbi:hypothetical protein TNIN_482461 [Trichonephila inaurata madagascariensis]|uniref:Uncharacterized protein n=1 Tax=Trichonephila inaurata madagascariensis TaxID=2747483 RepID=A0A8X6WPY1_9ARAC|nr:hypothetical protein TNIN_482461 [Trichonephila inaurata madagascariensis]